MPPERQSEGRVIGDDLLPLGRGTQGGQPSPAAAPAVGECGPRRAAARSVPATSQKARCRLPLRAANAPGGRQGFEITAIERAPAGRDPRTLAKGCAVRALRDEPLAAPASLDSDPARGRNPRRSAGLAPAAARARASSPMRLTPGIHRPHLHAVRARITHQLRRRIEAHRLAVEDFEDYEIGEEGDTPRKPRRNRGRHG